MITEYSLVLIVYFLIQIIYLNFEWQDSFFINSSLFSFTLKTIGNNKQLS